MDQSKSPINYSLKMKYLIIALISIGTLANVALSYKYFGTQRRRSEYLIPFIQYWSEQDSDFWKGAITISRYVNKNRTNLFDADKMIVDLNKIVVDEKIDDQLQLISQSLYSLVKGQQCNMKWLEPSLAMANFLFRLEQLAKEADKNEPIMKNNGKKESMYHMFSNKFKDIARTCLPRAKENIKSLVKVSDTIQVIDDMMKSAIIYKMSGKAKSEEEKLYYVAFKRDSLDKNLTDQQKLACQNFVIDSSDSLGMLILAAGFAPKEFDIGTESDQSVLKLLEYSRLCYTFNNWRSRVRHESFKNSLTYQRSNSESEGKSAHSVQ